MQRKPSHKRWRCPRCGAEYKSPLPILDAVCQRVMKHPSRGTVSMKPVKEEA